jgi:hypothetical protein
MSNIRKAALPGTSFNRYARMRFMISVALMPCPVAGYIHPICHQPDFTRHVLWAEDIHANKSCGVVDKMRTENESLLDLGIHIVGHDKSAEDANRLIFQWGTLPERTSSLSLRLQTVEKAISPRTGNSNPISN